MEQSRMEAYKAMKVEMTAPVKENKPRADYLTISQGVNEFRIFPPHLDENGLSTGSAIVPKRTCWLTVEKPVYENGVKTDKVETKRTPIFNSRVHSKMSKDIVEEYFHFVKNKIKEDFAGDEETQKNILHELTFWKTGINSRTNYVCYAQKLNVKGGEAEFGLLEFGLLVKKELDKLAYSIESGDDAVQVDPFSGVLDGYPIVIKKTGERLDTEYDVSFKQEKTKRPNGSFSMEVNPLPLTEEQLIAFDEYRSLKEMFVDSFKDSDFEFQLEGLLNFDEANHLGYFQSEEFQSTILEVRGQLEKYVGISNLPAITPESVQEGAEVQSSVTSYEEEEEDFEPIQESEEPKAAASYKDRLAEIKARQNQ